MLFILHGAQLLYAYGEATVPKITITLRKSMVVRILLWAVNNCAQILILLGQVQK